MQKQRMISTKFWSDTWVREKLNQLDRYLFLYFLTNEHTNISGIYELPLSTMSFETGFSRDELTETMLRRLEPKIYFHEGWVIMPNFLKHQNSKSPTIQAGIVYELEEVPQEIREKAIGYGYGMPTSSQIREDKLSKDKITKGKRLGVDSSNNPPWLNATAWEAWEKHRREIGKTLKDSTRNLQLSFLEKHQDDHVEIIMQSIEKGWTGLFELKGKSAPAQVYKSKIK